MGNNILDYFTDGELDIVRNVR